MSDKFKVMADAAAIQVRAATIQRACRYMPIENFFPVMMGHLATLDYKSALDFMTVMEIVANEHSEMLDSVLGPDHLAGRSIGPRKVAPTAGPMIEFLNKRRAKRRGK